MSPKAKPPASISGIFFTKSGQILTRKLDKAHASVLVPLNLTEDKRLFLKNGELVTPFVTFTFRHVKTVKAAGFPLALYEEVAIAEFDPTGMAPVAVESGRKKVAVFRRGCDHRLRHATSTLADTTRHWHPWRSESVV